VIGRYFYSIAHFSILLLSILIDDYQVLAISLAAIILFAVIEKLGKALVLRELIAFHGVFISLVMPVVGYNFYTKNNPLSALWIKYMLVPENVYFPFVLPAMAGFTLILCFPFSLKGPTDDGHYVRQLLDKIKEKLAAKPKLGNRMIIVGLIFWVLSDNTPAEVNFIFTLVYFVLFSGLLYVYFTPHYKYKNLVILSVTVLTVLRYVSIGSFTIIANMSITVFSFIFLGKKASLGKKLFVLCFCVFALIQIQLVKSAYREFIWNKGYKGNSAVLFYNLLVEKVTSSGSVFSVNDFFPIYTRANQGFNVSMVMRHIPTYAPFDQGERLMVVFASSFVPRFLWADKPEAGGKFNMLYYAGFNISGWSTNVGPLGEAYGSFGTAGGIAYMCFLSLLIRWFYRKVLLVTRKIPLVFLWIPFLFFQITYSAETDSLQILNGLFKSSMFVVILYWIIPEWFGVERGQLRKKTIHRNIKRTTLSAQV
jgi:hypothetical protein